MKQQERPSANFAGALRAARRAQGTTQEAFDLVSSRTYVSALERGIKNPTLPKVDQLAEVLRMHPLSVLMLAYLLKVDGTAPSLDELIGTVRSEVAHVVATAGLDDS